MNPVHCFFVFVLFLSVVTDSNKDIHALPLTMGRLRNCWELIINGLKITNVPHHLLPGVSRSGSTKHLLAYLRTQLRHCVPYNRMKLMTVGLQGRGKTTLLSVLRDPQAPLPSNVSTVGVNVAEWVVSPPVQTMKKYKASAVSGKGGGGGGASSGGAASRVSKSCCCWGGWVGGWVG